MTRPGTAVAPSMPNRDPGGPGVAPAPPSRPDRRLPQVFRAAARLLRQLGWHQGSDYAPDGRAICAGQALYLAALQVADDDAIALIADARSWLSRTLLDGEKVHAWNDHKRRILDEVLATLDRAADLAERAA